MHWRIIWADEDGINDEKELIAKNSEGLSSNFASNIKRV